MQTLLDGISHKIRKVNSIGFHFQTSSPPLSHCRRLHKLTHKPQEKREVFECAMCFTSFQSKSNLKRHTNGTCTLTDDVPKLICLTCDRKFGRIDSLKRHILSVHDGDDRKQCHICLEGFEDNDGLKAHTEHQHSKVKALRVEK